MVVTRLLVVIGLCTSALTLAQENRYMVFYKDKANSPYTLTAPEQFLSARSIARRSNQSISLTELDLPVNESYKVQVAETGAVILFSSKWFNASLIEATASEIAAIQGLSIVQSVAYVAPGKNGTGGRTGNKWTKHSEDPPTANILQNKMLGLDAMHSDGITGEGVLIAVLDSGFPGVNTTAPFNHIIQGNRILDSYNFAYQSDQVFAYDDHGTEVFSTIAAVSSGLYQGGAPAATYLLYVTEYVPTEYRVEEYFWAVATERADSAGVDIISSSLGYNEFDDQTMDYAYADLDGEHAVISKAAAFAFARGIVVVNSAGNVFPGSDWIRIAPPADVEQVLSVGSVDGLQNRASSSLTGPNANGTNKPDVMAMGAGASVVNFTGGIASASGTSFSAPQIASLVAGAWQMKPDLTAIEMVDLIRKAGSRYFAPDNLYGYGIPTYQAIKNILDFPSVGDGTFIYPNPAVNNELKIAIAPVQGQPVHFELSTIMGQPVYEQNYLANWNANPFTLDISSLSPGVYLAHVTMGNRTKTFRVIRP